MRYIPVNDDEVFDILNILDTRLKHSNSGVVLAATKLFLHFTRNMPDIQQDIFERLKTPLITLMSQNCAEVAFSVLHHIQLLLTRAPNLLEKEFSTFFCRHSEPSFVKAKKLEVLTEITTQVLQQGPPPTPLPSL